jgi:hypothetical protein
MSWLIPWISTQLLSNRLKHQAPRIHFPSPKPMVSSSREPSRQTSRVMNCRPFGCGRSEDSQSSAAAKFTCKSHNPCWRSSPSFQRLRMYLSQYQTFTCMMCHSITGFTTGAVSAPAVQRFNTVLLHSMSLLMSSSYVSTSKLHRRWSLRPWPTFPTRALAKNKDLTFLLGNISQSSLRSF